MPFVSYGGKKPSILNVLFGIYSFIMQLGLVQKQSKTQTLSRYNCRTTTYETRQNLAQKHFFKETTYTPNFNKSLKEGDCFGLVDFTWNVPVTMILSLLSVINWQQAEERHLVCRHSPTFWPPPKIFTAIADMAEWIARKEGVQVGYPLLIFL